MQHNVNRRPPAEQVRKHPLSYLLVGCITGAAGLLAASVLADQIGSAVSPSRISAVYADTAAVSSAFETMPTCDQHVLARLFQASRQVKLTMERVRPGLFYVAAHGTTIVVRCFAMRDGRHYIFLAGSGNERKSVDAGMAALYQEVAARD